MRDRTRGGPRGFLIVGSPIKENRGPAPLPAPPIDEEAALALSERDMLIARLLEYRAFKDAATQLATMIAENAGFIGRRAGPGREFDHLCPDLLARVSPADLAVIAARALAPKPVASLDLSHITPIRVSVAEAIATVMAMLAERASVTFREITKDCTTRIDKVVRFLAVLELIKRGHADVDQSENFGEITVKRGSGEARIDAGAVDEYEG